MVMDLCAVSHSLQPFLDPQVPLSPSQGAESETPRRSRRPCLLVVMDTHPLVRNKTNIFSRMAQVQFTAPCAEPGDSLSGCFPSRPSPVELHGAVKTAMGERLALAVRLARRDLLRSIAHGTSLIPAKTLPQVESLIHSQPETDNVPSHWGETNEAEMMGAPPLMTEDLTGCHKETNGGEEGRGEEGGKRVERAGRRGEGGSRVMSDEVVLLKMALAQQVKRLRELCASESREEGEEEEEEEEREQTAKQVSVMTRKLYDLQRWVSWLKPDFGGEFSQSSFLSGNVSMVDGSGKGSASANTRLAAARRAATRILHNFSSTHHSLPSQLLKLVGHLLDDRQSSELLTLAQTYSDALASAREQRQQSSQRQRQTRKAHSRHSPQRRAVSHTASEQGGRNRATHSSRTRQRPCTHKNLSTRGRGRKSGKKGVYQQQDRVCVPGSQLSSYPPPPSSSQPHPPLSSHSHSPPSSHPHLPPSTHPHPPQSSHPHPPPSTHPHPPQSSHSHPPPSPDSLHTTAMCSRPQESVLPHLVAMTITLQRIEEEELIISQKWNQAPTSIPVTTSPTYNSSSQTTATRISKVGRGRQGRDNHEDPWPGVDRLADSLLDEVLSGVCQEMEDACDMMANKLFSIEFQTPASETLHSKS